MTTKQWCFVLVATVLVSVTATFFAVKLLEDEPVVAGGVQGSLRSAALGADRQFSVHVPEGYEPDAGVPYPVLYVLDASSQLAHTAESAAALARIGVIPPIIVVGVPSPDGETRNRDYTPPELRVDAEAESSPKGSADRFHTFLTTELIPRIERDYRTTRPRMLAGWSRSGLFVIYSQLVAPADFDARFAHSPALWREGEAMVSRLEKALGGSVPPGFLYVSVGADENEKMKAAFAHAVQVLEHGAPTALRWRADLNVGGRHESNPRLSTPVGLCAMFSSGHDRSCRPVAEPR
jgi:predicted alpha/beta superfamily hydrolase